MHASVDQGCTVIAKFGLYQRSGMGTGVVKSFKIGIKIAWLRMAKKVKGKGFPYSIPSVGPGADPGVQVVSLQVTVTHPPGGRLPLLSARPAVTSPAAEHHRPLAGTKLICLVTEAHRCEQLA